MRNPLPLGALGPRYHVGVDAAGTALPNPHFPPTRSPAYVKCHINID